MKTKKLVTGILFSLLSTTALAQVVDRDSDGWVEINSLDDLNEIRNDPTGRTFRGSSEGCPEGGCFGFELTRDLDFDTNKNGYLDAGDWNGGKPWAALKIFGGFNGNGYSISNVLVTDPVIKEEGDLQYNYGIFDFVRYGYSLNDLRLISPKVIVDGSSIPANAKVNIGVIAGEAKLGIGGNTFIGRVDIENASIQFNRAANLQPLKKEASIGGFIGHSANSYISDISFDGSIQVTDTTPHHIGGILGRGYVDGIFDVMVSGSIYGGGHMGGVAGSAENVIFSQVSSDVDIKTYGSGMSGGVVGAFVVGTSNAAESTGNIFNAHTLGSIQKGGGFIGQLSTTNNASVYISGYSQVIVEDDGKFYAQLLGKKGGRDKVDGDRVYQIHNPKGVPLPSQPGGYTNSISLESFKSLTFSDKDIWTKDILSQLPRLKHDRRFPWSSTDNPDASGDYEGIGRLINHVPQYTCDNPSRFEVKDKKSSYVFAFEKESTNSYPQTEVFDIFNAKQGLKCSDAKQSDGHCQNYEVSYLCGGSGVIPRWSDWLSQDNSSGDDGDNEPVPASVCSQGEPQGIRARMVGKMTEHYGSPQIPKKFGLSKGFECVHEGNGPKGKANCKDYEVRMFCEY